MERLLSRSILKGRLRAICGHQGSDAQSGQTNARHVEFLRLAHEEVMEKRQWRNELTETLFTFGVDQRFYAYPDNTRAENIKAIGIWSNGVDTSSGMYLPMKRGQIGLTLDTDPISGAGGDPAVAVRAMPSRYHLRGQIEVWPRADIPYLGKIDHTVNPDLSAEESITVVDGIAVLHLAAAMEWKFLENDSLSDQHLKKGIDRLRLIHAWQEHGEVVSLDDDAVMHRIDGLDGRIDPSLIVDVRRPG